RARARRPRRQRLLPRLLTLPTRLLNARSETRVYALVAQNTERASQLSAIPPQGSAMAYPILPNAPIAEAIVELRVLLPPGTTVERLEELHGVLGPAYPTKKQQIHWQGQVNPTAEQVVVNETKTVIGYQFGSPDERDIVHARFDGFACS